MQNNESSPLMTLLPLVIFLVGTGIGIFYYLTEFQKVDRNPYKGEQVIETSEDSQESTEAKAETNAETGTSSPSDTQAQEYISLDIIAPEHVSLALEDTSTGALTGKTRKGSEDVEVNEIPYSEYSYDTSATEVAEIEKTFWVHIDRVVGKTYSLYADNAHVGDTVVVYIIHPGGAVRTELLSLDEKSNVYSISISEKDLNERNIQNISVIKL